MTNETFIIMDLGGGLSAGSQGDGEGKKSASVYEDGDSSSKPGGNKPQLRVYIPGQKEFVPRTVSSMDNCLYPQIVVFHTII